MGEPVVSCTFWAMWSIPVWLQPVITSEPWDVGMARVSSRIVRFSDTIMWNPSGVKRLFSRTKMFVASLGKADSMSLFQVLGM